MALSKTEAKNASLLYETPRGCFVAGKNEELKKISRWNLFGRLIRFFCNLNGRVDNEVNRIVLKTLEAIAKESAKATLPQKEGAVQLYLVGSRVSKNINHFLPQSSEANAVNTWDRISKVASSLDKKLKTIEPALQKSKESSLQSVQKTKESSPQCPEIFFDDWGEIKLMINGEEKSFRDVVILPPDQKQNTGKWDWNEIAEKTSEKRMSHHPGVRIADIDYHILEKLSVPPEVVILSQGRGYGGKCENSGPGILEIMPDVEQYLKSKGVKEVYILKTAPAIKKYKELQNSGKRVAALIHTTC